MKQSFYSFVKHSESLTGSQSEKYEKTRLIPKMLAALSVILFFAGGCGNRSFVLSENALPAQDEEQEASNPENENISDTDHNVREAETESGQTDIYVHICGAVERPGVYQIAAGSRLYEVILAAGGLKADADDSYINQALPLCDGMQIYIPTIEEAGQPSFSEETRAILSGEEPQDTELVNINTAGLTELCTLPGIGKTRAQAIIAYREKYGAFKTISELKKVNGIKDGIFEKIKDLIVV